MTIGFAIFLILLLLLVQKVPFIGVLIFLALLGALCAFLYWLWIMEAWFFIFVAIGAVIFFTFVQWLVAD